MPEQVEMGPRYRPWLYRFAVLLVVSTFILVALGGNVTSRDAGYAVPDGFTVYGYFLWAFPMDQWVGNIFHEHIHRLKGSVVGMLAIVLAVWLWPTAHRDGRVWLRKLGLFVLLLVIVQGLMGAFHVELGRRLPGYQRELAIVHAVVGQLFLCLTVVVAAALSRWWIDAAARPTSTDAEEATQRLSRAAWFFLAAVLVQLVLGATMRQYQAGLAIPDFPASFGRVVPPLTQAGIIEATDAVLPYDHPAAADGYATPMQVAINFAHRLWAVGVLLAAAWLLTAVGRGTSDRRLRWPAWALGWLLAVQVTLGALTVWSIRQPDLATAHQANGALILAVGTLLLLRIHLLRPARKAMASATSDRVPAPVGGMSDAGRMPITR